MQPAGAGKSCSIPYSSTQCVPSVLGPATATAATVPMRPNARYARIRESSSLSHVRPCALAACIAAGGDSVAVVASCQRAGTFGTLCNTIRPAFMHHYRTRNTRWAVSGGLGASRRLGSERYASPTKPSNNLKTDFPSCVWGYAQHGRNLYA